MVVINQNKDDTNYQPYKLGFEDRCYNSTEQINILLENLFIIFSYSLIFNHMRGWGLQYKSSNEIIQK